MPAENRVLNAVDLRVCLVDLGKPLSESDPGSPEALRLRTSIHEDLAMRHAIQLQ